MLQKTRKINDELLGRYAPPSKSHDGILGKLFGALLIFKQPLTKFPSEISIGASQSINIDIQGLLGDRCTGFQIIQVTGTVKVSINGGGLRTLPYDTALDDAWIRNLTVSTGALSSCIVQLNGI